MNIHRRLLALAALTAAAAGCQAPPPAAETKTPQEFLQKHYPPQEPPVCHIIRRDYRLREGDSLEIIYHIRHQETSEYKIKIQDVIVIRFLFNPDLNQTEQVQSDGTLRLDLVGKVYVFNRTIEDVQKELDGKYAKFIRDPQLTASFKQSNVDIAELKEAIKTAPRGQSRLVPIAPDGTISLPFIQNIRAAGLTVTELHAQLNSAYKTVGLPELEVTVNLQQAAATRVYVLGEVRIPGVQLDRTGLVTSSTEITMLQAIAQAGSYIPGRADLSKVLLVRRRHLDRPQVAIINVQQLLENRTNSASGAVAAEASNFRYDIWLEDGDIIYVPTAEIAKRADYIDYVWTRGIRAVGGLSTGATYNLGDTVNFIPPR
jgi:polysaccharide export outer membrane protein